MSLCIVIDPVARTFKEENIFVFNSVKPFQAIVGGPIEIYHRFNNGDILYGNENALRSSVKGFCRIRHSDTPPWPGKLILVGRQVSYASGDFFNANV